MDTTLDALAFFRVERAGPVSVCTLDKPPANTLDEDLFADLERLLAAIEIDDETRSVVFASANPRIFMAGADLKQISDDHFEPGPTARRVDRAQASFLRLQRLAKPTVAAIAGHALGGGCEFSLACDFRVMAENDARIGCPEITLGLVPGGGGTQRLPRLVGRMKATELLLLGRRVPALEAHEIGLINQTRSSAEETREAAIELAAELAEMPAPSLRLIKRCLNDGFDESLLRGLAVEREAAIEALQQPEAREGLAAFIEGRPPRFHS